MRHLLGILLALAILLAAAWAAASLLIDSHHLPTATSAAGANQRLGEQLEAALLLNPAKASYWNLRAQSVMASAPPVSARHLDLAESCWQQASALAPSWEVPLLNLAKQCVLRPASAPSEQAKPCGLFYLATLRRNPTYGFARYRYADFLYDQAGDSYLSPARLASICREYGQGLHLMGHTLRNSWYRKAESRAYGRCLALVTTYQQALWLQPASNRQWLLMGLGLGKNLGPKGWARASSSILRDFKEDGAGLDQYTALAAGLEKAGLSFASYEAMRAYVSSHPADPKGWLGLMLTMLRHKKAFTGSQVMVVIKQARKQAVFDLDQKLILAMAARRAGDMDSAINILRDAISADPSAPKAFIQLGDCLLAAARPKEAIEAYQKAVALVPTSPDYRVSLGMAYAKDKQYEAAVQEIQRALDLNPQHKKAKLTLKKIGIY